VAQALRLGVDHAQVHAFCRIDPWFLERLQEIVDMEARVLAHGLPASAELCRSLKAMGFSDARLAKLAGRSEAEVRAWRHGLGVRPVFKRIDTCAAEFAAPTAYMYSTYERPLTSPSPLSPEASLRLDVGEGREGGEPRTPVGVDLATPVTSAVGIPPTPNPSPQGGGGLAPASPSPVSPEASLRLDVGEGRGGGESRTPAVVDPSPPGGGGFSDEARPSDRDKIIILGGGPNRIGQGIEFDYCCCHACFSLTAAGFETIMINCNPETVSTDYDTSDRLYFEPLAAEDVLEIIRTEQQNGRLRGVIVQFGGQTPLKLAHPLEQAGVPILGTSPDAIDLAEDRDRFKALIEKLGLEQPQSGIARSPGEARAVADGIGYPVLIRPSYVLGGRAMEIVHDGGEVDRYVARLSAHLDRPSELVVSDRRPLLIDRYLADAVEVDVDCLADGRDTFIAGIMEHIEEAGIHSGDSACALPPHSLSSDIIAEIERQTRELALALQVVGLMNVQFAVKAGRVFVLEVNPRASRTVPFVAKVIGKPVAAIAAQVMAGKPLKEFDLRAARLGHVGVKEAVFPFARFPGVDPVLGPEMRSTGEVMGLDRDFAMAFGKSQLGAGQTLPTCGTVFASVREGDKDRIVAPLKELQAMGFRIIATRGTARHLVANGVACEVVNKVLEGRPNIVDVMKNGAVALVFNTTEGAKALADSKDIRRTALLHHIPYYTTLAGAVAVTRAIKALKADILKVAPLQSYVGRA
jgi:carbamoyl-phosphate synthase large subunit